jgi:hypothetical protein
MFDAFEKSYAAAVPLMVHDTGVQGDETIAVGVSAQPYTAVERRLGYHYAFFYGVERCAVADKHFPGAFVGGQARVPGGNDDGMTDDG